MVRKQPGLPSVVSRSMGLWSHFRAHVQSLTCVPWSVMVSRAEYFAAEIVELPVPPGQLAGSS